MMNFCIVLYLSIINWSQQVIYGNGLSPRVKQGPVFIYTPQKEITFVNSKGAVIECVAHGFPEPVIRWWIKSSTFPGDHVQEIQGVRTISSNGSLIIWPFDGYRYRQDVHANKYRCSASNRYGLIISTEVKIRAVVRQEYEAQVYDEYIEEGNTAVLRCQVPSYVTDDVTVSAWITSNNLVITSDSTYDGKHRMFHDGVLHVNHVTMEDGNLGFSCQTRHKVLGEIKVSSSQAKIIVSKSASTVPPRLVHSIPEIIVKEGEDIILPCIYHGSPVPSYSWHIKKPKGESIEIKKRERIKTEDGSLIIENALSSDSGTYICRTSNSLGSHSTLTTLIVSAPLTVYITPQAQVINGGNEAIFNCSIYGKPINTVIWLKNGEIIREENRLNEKLNWKNLRIKSVDYDDEAMYQCFAENGMEQSQGSAQLLLGQSKPRFIETFNGRLMQSGPSLSLTCKTVGTPQPVITWFLDGLPITEFDHIEQDHNTDSHGAVTGTVNIRSLRVTDGGLYKCNAHNSVGNVSHTSVVNVYGLPFIRNMKNISIAAGSQVILPCYAGGYPISSFEWKKDGMLVQSNGKYEVFLNRSLKILKIKKNEDDGSYKCTIDNGQGQHVSGEMFLEILQKPILEPMPDRSVSEGRSVRITCTISDGDKPVTLSWLKDSKPLDHSLGVTITEHQFISILTIDHVHNQHDGNYTCIAKNAAGAVNNTVSVKVKMPPTWIKKPSNTKASIGSNTQLNCIVKGHPTPSIQWFKLKGDSEIKITSQAGKYKILANETLVIANASKFDDGHYSCQASNGLGRNLEQSFYFNVGDAPLVKIITKHRVFNSGDNLIIVCKMQGIGVKGEWRFNDKPLNNYLPKDSFLEKIQHLNMEWTSELQLKSVKSSFSGLYSCIGSNDFGSNFSKVFIKISGVPGIAKNLQVEKVSSNTVKISWIIYQSSYNPIKYFIIKYKSEDEVEYTEKSTDGFKTSSVIFISSPEKVYSVMISAVNSIGQSQFSEPINFYLMKNGTVAYREKLIGGGQKDTSSETLYLFEYPWFKITISAAGALILMICLILILIRVKKKRTKRKSQSSPDGLKRAGLLTVDNDKSSTSPTLDRKKKIVLEDAEGYGLVGNHSDYARSDIGSRYVIKTPPNSAYYSDVSPYATFCLSERDESKLKVEMTTFSPRQSVEVATEL